MVRGLRCDLTKEEDILAAFRWIQTSFGGVDVLVNCAGYMGKQMIPSPLLSSLYFFYFFYKHLIENPPRFRPFFPRIGVMGWMKERFSADAR